MTAKVFTIFSDHFMRYYGAVLDTKQPEHGGKRSYQCELKGGIVKSFKAIGTVDTVIENPGAAAGSGGIHNAFETVFDIMGRHATAGAIGKCIVVVKINIVAQVKSIDAAIIRHFPVCSQ